MERRIETIGRRRLDADASAAIAERWPFLQLVSLLYFFPIVSVFFMNPVFFFAYWQYCKPTGRPLCALLFPYLTWPLRNDQFFLLQPFDGVVSQPFETVLP